MSTADSKSRVRRFFREVVSAGNLEAIDELLDASCQYFDGGSLRASGLDEFTEYLVQARRPFDSIDVKIENIIAEGSQVAVRCSYHLRLEGKDSVVPVMADFRFEEGKIVEMWRAVAVRNKET
jgi:predicted SnoaL-like aldol condensation-catalyzing enzyme